MGPARLKLHARRFAFAGARDDARRICLGVAAREWVARHHSWDAAAAAAALAGLEDR